MLWPALSKASLSQNIKTMCVSCRAPGHNTPPQLMVPGGAGLLGSPTGFRGRGSEDLSTPSEEWCRMKFKNASKMATWQLLTTSDLGGKPNLSFQCWKLARGRSDD